jgi:acyl carrier protein
MFEEVKSVIIDVLGVSEDEVTPDASLTDDLGAGSLDAVAIGNSIEEKTGVAISDEDLPTLKTVQDIVDYVEAHK